MLTSLVDQTQLLTSAALRHDIDAFRDADTMLADLASDASLDLTRFIEIYNRLRATVAANQPASPGPPKGIGRLEPPGAPKMRWPAGR